MTFSRETIDTRIEGGRVSNNLQRALCIGAPATLTLDEWLDTLVLFNGLCAYCQENPFEEMDHLYPMVYGGGTTKRNSIPSCQSCNRKKSSKIGNDIDETLTLVEAVKQTLASLHPNKTEDVEREELIAIQVRFEDDLYEEIKASAKANHRSFNNEVIHRLTQKKAEEEDST